MLEFKEEGHLYLWNEKIVPSVTQVISSCIPKFFVDSELMAKAAIFGTEVHTVTAFYDRGEIDKLDYDEQIKPYLNGWIKFLTEHKPHKKLLLVDIKTGAFSPIWHIQTAAYLQLLIESGMNLQKPLIEWQFYSQKYGFAGTLDRAYLPKKILNGSTKKIKRLIVKLVPDGYELFFPKNPWQMDFNIFLSMLNIYKWREKNNLLKKENQNHE